MNILGTLNIGNIKSIELPLGNKSYFLFGYEILIYKGTYGSTFNMVTCHLKMDTELIIQLNNIERRRFRTINKELKHLK